MMIPISKWRDLTDDEEVIEALYDVYGDDVEKLDLQVGLMVEKKIKGFAISATAFFLFILTASRYAPCHTKNKTTNFIFFFFLECTNASFCTMMLFRRLEADRFFTSSFNSKTYTQQGLEWVNKTETLKDVIDRHFPEMTRKWMTCSSAFSVWDSMPNPVIYIPLYLQLST